MGVPTTIATSLLSYLMTTPPDVLRASSLILSVVWGTGMLTVLDVVVLVTVKGGSGGVVAAVVVVFFFDRFLANGVFG